MSLLLGHSTTSAGEPVVYRSRYMRCKQLNQENFINQLREITGVQDDDALSHVYEASGRDINRAIAILTESANCSTAAANAPREPTLPNSGAPTVSSAGMGDEEAMLLAAAAGVIDLTHDTDEKDDLQRAIALSLRDAPGPSTGTEISSEEQDFMRALEQSMADNKSDVQPTEPWFSDPLNPHSRARLNQWPVGLKNVGNTCWFSAVIQSLFHLPKFRRMVLNFTASASPASRPPTAAPPAESTGPANAVSTEEHRNLLFVMELRALFALMLGTKRKYVDPSKAVNILKGSFSNSGSVANSQQDVSEFTHKLLDWLEDAFESDCSSTPSSQAGEAVAAAAGTTATETSRRNPMLDVFYGQFKAEGINAGKTFTNQETFGQYPLQISGYDDLHESIEASMSHREIESVNGTNEKSAQEHWFTRLPHVLIFELSRFHFNQAIGRPEKIHNRFDFPKILYMDRYMECNQAGIRAKRADVHQLVRQLDGYQRRLERYISYGSGPKRFPLQDVLQYALEFAHSASPEGDPAGRQGAAAVQDVEMASPPRSPTGSHSPLRFGPDHKPPPPTSSATDVAMSSPTFLPGTSPDSSPSGGGASMMVPPGASPPGAPPLSEPSPRHITDNELGILQGCLRRWRTEVKDDVRNLQDKIARLRDLKSSVYEDDHLRKHRYDLHAVLAHKGQASAGHYWAYILGHNPRDAWLKFNDVAVTEVAWEDVERESVGGAGNVSAYCLMYVDTNRRDLFEEHGGCHGDVSGRMGQLADDLEKLVREDNGRFVAEMKTWDENKDKKGTKAAATSSSTKDKGTWLVAKKSGLPKNMPQPSSSSLAFLPGAKLSTPSPPTRSTAPGGIGERAMGQESPRCMPKCPPLSSSATVSLNKIFSEQDKENVLEEACLKEQQRLRELLALDLCPQRDIRLENPAIYYMKNKAPRLTIRRGILTQLVLAKGDVSSQALKKFAQSKLESDNQMASDITRQTHQNWEEDYAAFCRANALFVQGVTLFYQQETYGYQEALPYFVHACKINDRFLDGNREKAMDFAMLANFRRQCLLQLNAQCTNQFESPEEQEALQGLLIMNNLVVPCVALLTNSAYREDTATAEEIRNGWCTYLGREVSGKLQDKFQDFLSKLFESSSAEPASIKAPPIIHNKLETLSEGFSNAMSLIQTTERTIAGT